MDMEMARDMEHRKDKAMVTKRRWRRVCIFVILMVVVCFVIITAVNYCKSIREHLCISICNSNLKQLMNVLDVYSNNQKEGEIVPPRDYPPLKVLVEDGVLDCETFENLVYCPKTHTKYIYVQYDRPVARQGSTAAANTPVLFDSVIGAHCHRRRNNMFGMGTDDLWTMVVLEDGHVSFEENLTCFKDIYDRHAKFMSKEDAEVLRKCCEAADR